MSLAFWKPYTLASVVDLPPVAVISTPVVNGFIVDLTSASSYDPNADPITAWEWEINGQVSLIYTGGLQAFSLDVGPYIPAEGRDFDVALRVFANGQWSNQIFDSFTITAATIDEIYMPQAAALFTPADGMLEVPIALARTKTGVPLANPTLFTLEIRDEFDTLIYSKTAPWGDDAAGNWTNVAVVFDIATDLSEGGKLYFLADEDAGEHKVKITTAAGADQASHEITVDTRMQYLNVIDAASGDPIDGTVFPFTMFDLTVITNSTERTNWFTANYPDATDETLSPLVYKRKVDDPDPKQVNIEAAMLQEGATTPILSTLSNAVVHVTSGADSGAGTLRNVMAALAFNTTPTTVIIDVPMVTTASNLPVYDLDRVTIVGAPTTINGFGLVSSDAVLDIRRVDHFALRNCRVYSAEESVAHEERCIKVIDGTNVLIERNAFAFAADQNTAYTDVVNLVDRQNINIYSRDDPGAGIWILDNPGISRGRAAVYNNLFAHAVGRPILDKCDVVMSRNIFYDYGNSTASSAPSHIQLSLNLPTCDLYGNLCQGGPSTLIGGAVHPGVGPLIAPTSGAVTAGGVTGDLIYADGANRMRDSAGTVYPASFLFGPGAGGQLNPPASTFRVHPTACGTPVLDGNDANAHTVALAFLNSGAVGTTSHDCVEDKAIADFENITGSVLISGDDGPSQVGYDPVTGTCGVMLANNTTSMSLMGTPMIRV